MGTVAFKTEENPNFSCKHTTTIQKTKVVLINTPDLLFLKMPEERLKEHIDHCVRLSDPGPHLFLLVVQMESFMEEKKKSFYKILELFSDQSFNHSLVLKLKLTQRVPITNEPLEELIRRCQKNSHILDYKNINGLLNTIGDILEMNNEKHLKVNHPSIKQKEDYSSLVSTTGKSCKESCLVLLYYIFLLLESVNLYKIRIFIYLLLPDAMKISEPGVNFLKTSLHFTMYSCIHIAIVYLFLKF